MAVLEIPLSGYQETFSIALGEKYYQLTLQWRDVWTLDIADSDGVNILTGIPLVMGLDLFTQYGYLGFGGGLYLASNTGSELPPSYDNLATDYVLAYAT